MPFNQLLSVRLAQMWRGAAQNGLSSEECAARQQRELDQCAQIWSRALLLSGESDLVHSTLLEIAVATVDALHRWLKPGGYIYGRFASEVDRDRPQHIVRSFEPVFERFAELGYREVFRDEWLWGHQVFQRTL